MTLTPEQEKRELAAFEVAAFKAWREGKSIDPRDAWLARAERAQIEIQALEIRIDSLEDQIMNDTWNG